MVVPGVRKPASSRVAFSPDGTLLAACAADNRLKVWDAEAARLLVECTDTSSASISAKQREDRPSLIARSEDDSGYLGLRVTAMCWGSRENPHLSSAKPKKSKHKPQLQTLIAVGTTQGDVMAWDVAQGVCTWHAKKALSSSVTALTSDVLPFIAGAAQSPQQATFYAANADGTVVAISAQDGTVLRSFQAAKSPITALAVNPKSSLLLVGCSEIRIFDPSTGQRKKKFSGHAGGSISAADVAQNGVFAISAAHGERHVALWDLNAGGVDQKGGKTVGSAAILSVPDPVLYLSCCSRADSAEAVTDVLAVTEQGEVYVWSGVSPADVASSQPIVIKGGVGKAAKAKTAGVLTAAWLPANSGQQGKITLARGSVSLPAFQSLDVQRAAGSGSAKKSGKPGIVLLDAPEAPRLIGREAREKAGGVNGAVDGEEEEGEGESEEGEGEDEDMGEDGSEDEEEEEGEEGGEVLVTASERRIGGKNSKGSTEQAGKRKVVTVMGADRAANGVLLRPQVGVAGQKRGHGGEEGEGDEEDEDGEEDEDDEEEQGGQKSAAKSLAGWERVSGEKSTGITQPGHVVGDKDQGEGDGEKTIEEQLVELGLNPTGSNAAASQAGKGEDDSAVVPFQAPRAGSLSTALQQALLADDSSLLFRCLDAGSADADLARESVRQLSPRAALRLLSALLARLEERPNQAGALLPWVKSLVQVHAGLLASSPAAQRGLAGLYQAVDARVVSLRPMLELSGRLELVVGVLRERHIAFKRGEEGARGQGEATSGPLQPGVAVYDEEEDSDVELEDARALATGAHASFEDTTLRAGSGKVNGAAFDEDEDEGGHDSEGEDDEMLVDEEDDEDEDAEEEEDDEEDEDGL